MQKETTNKTKELKIESDELDQRLFEEIPAQLRAGFFSIKRNALRSCTESRCGWKRRRI